MISFIVAFFALIITSHLVIDGSSSSAEVRVKFKVLHGRIIDSSKEVNDTYFIFLNMRSFREDFAPWLVYMALSKDYDWWGKGSSLIVKRSPSTVTSQYFCIFLVTVGGSSRYRSEPLTVEAHPLVA